MTKTLPEKLTPNRDEVLKALGAVSETEYKKLQEQLQIAKASDESAHIRLYNERGETRKLQKQLDIATKALKRIFYERDERAVGDYLWIASKALKEMEEV